MHRFNENIKADIALILAAATATATTYTGTGVNMAKYNNYAAHIGGVAAAGTNNIGALTCYIAQSTDQTTWSSTYLATATAASATGGLTFGTTIEIRAEQMTDAYKYLRVEVLPAGGTANMIVAGQYRFNARFGQATLATQ